jgi:hypothetical protein
VAVIVVVEAAVDMDLTLGTGVPSLAAVAMRCRRSLAVVTADLVVAELAVAGALLVVVAAHRRPQLGRAGAGAAPDRGRPEGPAPRLRRIEELLDK